MTIFSRYFMPLLCGTLFIPSTWAMDTGVPLIEETSVIPTLHITHDDHEDLEMGQFVKSDDIINLIKERYPHLVIHAVNILKEVYEANPRPIESKGQKSKYGQSFALHPEFMLYLMEQCEGKTILELGAASGENSLLFGCAGAKRIYVNDIEPVELEKFKEKLKSFPKNFQKKFKILEGDCFKQLKGLSPKSIDVVYVRNLFHFFKLSQHTPYFDLVKKAIKPGGTIAMSVNNGHSDLPLGVSKDAICFETHSLVLDIFGREPSTRIIDRHMDEGKDLDSDPLTYENDDVVYFEDNTYKAIRDVTLKTPKELMEKLRTFLKRNRENFPYLSKTSAQIRLLKNTSMCFSRYNLGLTLKNHGFNVVKLSDIDSNGHTFQSVDPNRPNYKDPKQAVFVGVIAKFDPKN